MKCYEDIIYLTLNTKITNSLCEVQESIKLQSSPVRGEWYSRQFYILCVFKINNRIRKS